jgi:hypothetical protein
MTTAIRSLLKGELAEGLMTSFLRFNWIIGGLAAMGFYLWRQDMFGGVVMGLLIANLNCLGLQRDCNRVVRWGNIFLYYGGLAVRMALITLAVTVIFLFLPVKISPVGLFIGLSVPVANFYLIVAMILFYKFRVKEA